MLFWCIQIYQLLVVYIYLLIFVWKRIFHLISYSLTLTTLTTHKIVHSHFFFLAFASLVDSAPPPQITETGKNFPSNVIFCFSRVCFRKARIFCWGKKKISHRAKTRLFGKIGGFFFFFLPSRALETEKNTLYGPTYVYLHGYGYICIAVYLYLYNYIYIL